MDAVLHKDLGLIAYQECLDRQRECFDALLRAKRAGEPTGGLQTVILCEHNHVYTLGKSGDGNNLLAGNRILADIGAEFYRTDRGGDITYHGPGQLVGYPIIDLECFGMGIRKYIESLEQVIIDLLAVYGITAGRSEGAAGVWLEPSGGMPLRKICAIGVRSSGFVTMHGFALNINPDMKYYDYINPCGFTDRGVTSLSRELGREVDMEEVKSVFRDKFGQVFRPVK